MARQDDRGRRRRQRRADAASTSKAGTLTEDEIRQGLRARAIKNEIVLSMCGTAFKNKGVQALLDAIIEFMPSPTEMPDVKGTDRAASRPRARPPTMQPFSALAFKILNDPFVGNLTFFRVYSGHAQFGRHRVRADQGQERAHRPPAADARERAHRDQGSARRRHRLGRGPEGRDHRRHAVRSRQAHHAREDGVPGARHLGGGRAEDQGRPGKDGRRAAAPREGRPFVPRAHRRGVRPDHHLRHGRAAPRDHRRPHEARVQGRGERRQAAGRVSRDDPRQGREPKASSCASPAAAASTATAGSRSSRTSRARATSSSTAWSAARCRASSSRPSTRASRKRSRPASSRAIPSST